MSSGHTPINTNVNLLVALDLLLAECSVSKAARAAGITQSAMSNALAQLRSLLGDPLLVRVGRSMEPTPVALALIPELRSGVDSFSKVLAGEREFDPSTSREDFVFALSDRVEVLLFPSLLTAVRRVAPGVSIQVLSWGHLAPHPGLADGGVDLSSGIIIDKTSPAHDHRRWPSAVPGLAKGMHGERIFHAGLATIVRKGHPGVGKRLTIKAFAKLEHLLVTNGRGATGIVDDALVRAGLQRRIAARVPHHQLVGELVATTDLVATIDHRIAARHAREYDLRLFKTPVDLPRAGLGIFWHDRTHADPARRWLRAQVQAVAATI